MGERNKFVFFGYSFSAIFRFLLYFASTWQQVIGFVSFERIRKVRDAPRDTIVLGSTKKRGHGFGFLQMMDTSGAILGTLLAIFFFWKLQFDFRIIIFIAALISLVSVLPLFFVNDPKRTKINKTMFEGVRELDYNLKYFIFVSSTFSLANFGLYMFLLVRAQELSGNFITPLIMYIFFNLSYALF